MPIFIDRHDLTGLTQEQLDHAHKLDMEAQGEFGVKFITHWYDPDRESGFCLIDAPSKELALKVHEETHGNLAVDIIEVELSAVEAFLGRISVPAGTDLDVHDEPEAAFRAVMFTDIVGSTEMTSRVGDTKSVELVRAHDSLVRRALSDTDGREVKHTGDGIMACFKDPSAGVRCAQSIHSSFDIFNMASAEKLRVRIGLDAGQPVEDSNDLFGSTVQKAARLCAEATEESIFVSDTVYELTKDEFLATVIGQRSLKGFADPVAIYEVPWR